MRKLTPWTLLLRRLQPIADELDRATPWRVEAPKTVEQWLMELTWFDLLLGDDQCRALCREPVTLAMLPESLTDAVEGSDWREDSQTRSARQLMHRLIFARDLARRLPAAFRRSHNLTGDYAHDAEEILIRAWRTSSALYWAKHFGPRYCETAI